MLLHKTPNHAKLCGDRLKNVGDIRDREFVLPEKVGQSSPKIFRGCYPLRPPIMPNFIEIGQTSLEIGVGRKKNFHTQTEGLTHGILTGWVAPRSMREARLKIHALFSPPRPRICLPGGLGYNFVSVNFFLIYLKPVRPTSRSTGPICPRL